MEVGGGGGGGGDSSDSGCCYQWSSTPCEGAPGSGLKAWPIGSFRGDGGDCRGGGNGGVGGDVGGSSSGGGSGISGSGGHGLFILCS